MKLSMRSVATGVLTLAVATGGLLLGGGIASADVTPGWETDSVARGSVVFKDAGGQVITGGSTTASPFVASAEALALPASPPRPSDTKATLFAATPVFPLPPAQWTATDFLSASTTYPAGGTPKAAGQAGDLSLADYVAANPNVSTDPNWAGLYQIKLVTSGTSGQDSRYFRTIIRVTGNTWSVVFPAAATATTTTLTASPASPAPSGSTVNLTANVAPTNAPGSVHFFDGATDLGAGTYNQATGVATFAAHPADGNHSFTAQFQPTDSNAFAGSTSAALPYTVTPAGTPTATTLSANPPSGTAAGSGGTLSVTLTSNTTPVNTPGGVHFFDGATDLGAGTYTQATGVATLTVTLTVGNHPLIATFTPSVGGFQPSSSAILNYAVVGANSAAIPIDALDNTAPFAGSLVLQVATGTAVHMTQVDPTTAAGHPVISTDPTGHRHAWVFTGNLTGVSVVDTRPDTSAGGHGIGWTLNGQAASFVNGTTNYPASYLGWAPTLVAAGSDAEGSVTAGGAIDSLLKTAASDGLLSSKTFARAAAGNGLGTQNVSSGFELRIPDTSPTGTYASTLTVTLVSP